MPPTQRLNHILSFLDVISPSPITLCIYLMSRPSHTHRTEAKNPFPSKSPGLTLPGPPKLSHRRSPEHRLRGGGGAPGHPALTSAVARCAAIPRIIRCGRCGGTQAGTTGRMQAGQQSRLPFRPQTFPTHAAMLQKLLRLATAPRGGRRGCRGRGG